MNELDSKLYSFLQNAVHAGFNISCLSDYIQDRLMELGKNKREDVGHVLVIDTGGQTTMSGTGKIFDEFKESEKLHWLWSGTQNFLQEGI